MIYGPQQRAAIAEHVDEVAPPQTAKSIAENPSLLTDVDVIFSGWGAPLLNTAFLDAAPQLKAFFYGAGALGSVVTPAVWQRGILVTSAIAANAVPVAEFTLATTLYSLKQGWRMSRRMTADNVGRNWNDHHLIPGAYGSTVGLISMGFIARLLVKLLAPFDLKVIAYDPFLTAAHAREMGIELVSLDDVFRRSDVVSLHAPLLTETRGMIEGRHLSLMKPDATFINTARGAIVREAEMIDVLSQRPDLTALLDVTFPEPPRADSPLYRLPNVVLTPHIAGSVGRECQRMGQYMVDELHRFVAGQPLKWSVTEAEAANSSHRPVNE
jgi:phosphoglycerate dehydrogenase-like enzyme